MDLLLATLLDRGGQDGSKSGLESKIGCVGEKVWIKIYIFSLRLNESG